MSWLGKFSFSWWWCCCCWLLWNHVVVVVTPLLAEVILWNMICLNRNCQTTMATTTLSFLFSSFHSRAHLEIFLLYTKLGASTKWLGWLCHKRRYRIEIVMLLLIDYQKPVPSLWIPEYFKEEEETGNNFVNDYIAISSIAVRVVLGVFFCPLSTD